MEKYYKCGCFAAVKKTYGISLLFVILLSIPVFASSPAGDLDGNYYVDFPDLILFSQQWMSDADCFGGPGCADLEGDNTVNLEDFALIVQNWLIRGEITLVINEFMAANENTLEDPDEPGEYPDWIEIYNYGDDPVIMGGMFLEDDSNIWQIPPGISIDPGEHVLFWADDDDEQGEYHTNFKLGKSSDTITLLSYDSETIIDTISFSDQQSDISFGRYPDGTDDWYSMDSPTPGTANNVGMAGEVYFSRLGGTFTDSFLLTLSTESPTGQIRFTTNGSVPTPSSFLYTWPFTITNSNALRIRARVYDSSLAPGPVRTEVYIPLESAIENFSSNLPIVVIDSFGEDIDNNGGAGCFSFNYAMHNVASVFIDTDSVGTANITDLADYAGRGGMRIRGESSRCWPKRQYSLETWQQDDFVDKKVSLLGLPEGSDWVLNAPYGDKTLMRNILAYKWSNDIGQYAPRTRLVEVFFNQANGRTSYDDYLGVYVLTEKVKIADNRVDIATLDSGDVAEPDITGGYLLRIDKSNGQEVFWTAANMTGSSLGIQYYDPDGFTLLQTQKNWIREWLNKFETDLLANDFNDPSAGYAQHIDIENFIEYNIILELFKNADSFKLSTYFYKKRDGKLHFGPQWDMNFSSGNTKNDFWGYPANYSKADTSEGWFCDEAEFAAYGWHNRLLQDADYKMRYADKWFAHREDKLSDAQVNADIDYYYDLLTTGGAAERNFNKWNILATWVECNYFVSGWQTGSSSNSTNYLAEVEWLRNWFNGQGTPAGSESYSPDYSDRLDWLDLLWESNSNICRPPEMRINGTTLDKGGQVNAGDELTMVSPCSGSIYYTTDGTDPRTWTTGPTASFDAVLVEEGAAKAVLVPTGAINDDWRGGNEPFDDSAWTDYSFIAGKPGSVGYENNDGYQDLISYDVKNYLLNNANTQSCLIRIPFSVDAGQLPNMNYMTLRMRHDDAFVAYINGTEVLRSSLVPDPLLWSSGTLDGGWIDDADNLVDYDITAFLGTLTAGSNNVLAIHALNSGPTSSDFLISAQLQAGSVGSGIVIGCDISGSAIQYTGPVNLTKSVCIMARLKDGDNWGALNEACYSVGPVAQYLRVTEIMYHPADPNHEFIEVENTGSAAIDLAWVKFTNGIDFTFPSLTLQAGQHAVVVRNRAMFEALYGSSMIIAGQFDGALDNSGEEIVLRDASGVEILDFDYDDHWLPITDGAGFSLNIIDEFNPDPRSWDDKDSWQASSTINGSPGQDNPPNAAPNGTVVINEILTHSDSYPNDWIELYNTSGSPVDIGGWFLSDDKDNLRKYRIAEGTYIPPNGYRCFTQDDNFGSNAADHGKLVAFGLSELGESVYLSSGDSGHLSGGYSVGEEFGAAQREVTFGRHIKSAAEDYNIDFVAMETPTFESANSLPSTIGVVINEIMYNPSITQDELGEYIELKNTTDSPVQLFDPLNPSSTWKFTKGIDFTFPAAVSIPANGCIIIARTDPVIFRAIYPSVPPSVSVYGPFVNSKLENDGEKIELSRPGEPEPSGFVPYIRVEQINYSDGTHPIGDDPWPTAADGNGFSLHRISPETSYSNDVANWSASSPTPGI